jgi:hypothetical protein
MEDEAMDNSSTQIGSALQRRRIGAVCAGAILAVASIDSSSGAAAAATYCSDTARYVHRACGFGAQADYWISAAVCINEPDEAERKKCLTDANQQRNDDDALCAEQLQGRFGACKSLGEQRYDPKFEPQLFDSDFTRLSQPNRYFPLRIGNRWEYAGGTETNTVEVLNETKLIDDVRCIVVRDQVYRDRQLAEATDDWYAQAKDGAVWYCGEEVKSYESFAGDMPQTLELVHIDGSFKADRDGAEPGIIFLGQPVVGKSYLEEFSLGNAEDVADILSTTYTYGAEAELDRHVPRQLAQLLCKEDCVVTNNYSLLEPGVAERKYYAPGIGIFLELNPDTGEHTQLVDCNFDRRCRALPRP